MTHKRCACDEARWAKCPHPWYMDKFRWQGASYAPNLTRYAQDVLREELTTRTRADELVELVRTAIRAGTYTSAKATSLVRPVEVEALVVDAALARFAVEVVDANPHTRAQTKAYVKSNLATFAAFKVHGARLGERALVALAISDVLAFRNGPELVRCPNSTWAKYRTALGQLFAWAKAEQLVPVDLFEHARLDQKRALRRGKAASRTRRLTPADEASLIVAVRKTSHEAAGARLERLILAAVETGMRRGELLALQWGDVNLDERAIFVRAVEVGASKTGTARTLPISQRLLDELRTMQHDPTGARWGRSAYVFGNEVGEKVTKIAKVWESAVLRAHGVTPVWVKNGNLSPACRDRLARIDWHFHDLRHEAGCRWLESKSFDLEQIRQMYGHTTIAQTATYLHASTSSTRTAMQQYDAQQRLAQEQAKVANAPETGSGVHKLSTNRKVGARTTRGPRLVKGAKL